MSNTATLQFTTTYDGQYFQVVAEVIGGTAPRDIFIYRNHQEESQLTDFLSVATLDNLPSAPRWSPGPGQPVFGVPYLKWVTAQKAFSTQDECRAWKTLIKKDVRTLLDELDLQQPIVEVVDA